jgi:hypothetical protein
MSIHIVTKKLTQVHADVLVLNEGSLEWIKEFCPWNEAKKSEALGISWFKKKETGILSVPFHKESFPTLYFVSGPEIISYENARFEIAAYYQEIFEKCLEDKVSSVAFPLFIRNLSEEDNQKILKLFKGSVYDKALNITLAKEPMDKDALYGLTCYLPISSPEDFEDYDAKNHPVDSADCETLRDYINHYFESRYPKKDNTYEKAWDFLVDTLGQGNRLNLNKYLSKYDNHKKDSRKVNCKKTYAFAITMGLKMNEEDAKAFFGFCGYAFSDAIPEDRYFLFCINGRFYSEFDDVKEYYETRFHHPLLSSGPSETASD